MYSAVIPVYNRPFLVRDAIESVLIQSVKPDRIIVVDDCSDIPLEQFVKPYLSLITLIRLESRCGVSITRNIGAAANASKYVAFLDSDDIWLPLKAEMQIAKMEETGLKVSHTNELWFRKDRWVNQGAAHTKYGGNIFCKLVDKCRISPSSLVVGRELFSESGGFDESLRVCEDYEYSLRLSVTSEIAYLPEKLIIKRALGEHSLSESILHIESVRLNILKNFISKYKLSYEYYECAERELERKRRIVLRGINDEKQ